MDFFDRLTKTVSDASQKTIAKTKEIADTSRLNSQVSEEEKKITNKYTQIGNLYVSLHRDDCEEGFAEMISEVVESEQKIEEYKAQIRKLKGVRICEKCGAEVAKDDLFCSICGTEMPKPVVEIPQAGIKCANCGTMVEKGTRFCIICGKPIVEVEVAKSPVCQGCGAELTEGMRFCTSCGKPVETTAEAEKVPALPESAPEEVQDAVQEVQIPEVDEHPAAAPEEEAVVFDPVCPKCGSGIDEDSAFCTVCGTKLK